MKTSERFFHGAVIFVFVAVRTPYFLPGGHWAVSSGAVTIKAAVDALAQVSWWTRTQPSQVYNEGCSCWVRRSCSSFCWALEDTAEELHAPVSSVWGPIVPRPHQHLKALQPSCWVCGGISPSFYCAFPWCGRCKGPEHHFTCWLVIRTSSCRRCLFMPLPHFKIRFSFPSVWQEFSLPSVLWCSDF